MLNACTARVYVISRAPVSAISLLELHSINGLLVGPNQYGHNYFFMVVEQVDSFMAWPVPLRELSGDAHPTSWNVLRLHD